VDDVNRPEVVAEVTAAFWRYENALVVADLEVLSQSFWDDEATVRFGVADRQIGAAALRAWRAGQGPLPGRQLFDTQVTTFGDSAASVTTMFRYPGRPRTGRQSQMWVRFESEWHIVSAHVSEIAAPPDE